MIYVFLRQLNIIIIKNCTINNYILLKYVYNVDKKLSYNICMRFTFSLNKKNTLNPCKQNTVRVLFIMAFCYCATMTAYSVYYIFTPPGHVNT